MTNYRGFMFVSYIICTAVSFFHVYRFFQENIFPNEIAAAIAAISIDIAILAFLKLIHLEPDMKHVGLSMVFFLGFAAFSANAFDSYFGGKSIENVLHSNFFSDFKLVNFLQFLVTGLLAPLVMIVSAFVLFAPEVFKNNPKQQAQGQPKTNAGNHQPQQNARKETANFQ